MLTTKQIHRLIELTKEEVVVEPSEQFPFVVKRRTSVGYSLDLELAEIQARLSIMLQVATR